MGPTKKEQYLNHYQWSPMAPHPDLALWQPLEPIEDQSEPSALF
jgi:hypothetical protein